MSRSFNSPTKDNNTFLAPPSGITINPSSSPGQHRGLRRLQSAHNLGASDIRGSVQPSLILQHRQQQLQHQQPLRTVSPVLKDQSNVSNLSSNPQNRIRSNSDAPVMNVRGGGTAVREQARSKRTGVVETISLDRLIREGPPDGDLAGALEGTRLKILDQGIKSDSDGMVDFHTPLFQGLLLMILSPQSGFTCGLFF